MELQRFHGHDLNLLESRDVISHMTTGLAIHAYRWFPIGGLLKPTNTISRMVVEICCAKQLAKRIPVESALIPVFVF